ncbi:MAG TPA: hypothetical protein VLK23_14825 [Thermodesulfobacteriota bacterium]|nr:hypothetical protein [Thermodesulfobacteriota bacterium]
MNKNQSGVPVITRCFASREIRPGETWKVYIQATDPAGDMKTIICVVNQAGRGSYPVSYLKVPEGQGGELSGFIYLNTGAGQSLPFIQLTLQVEIQDRAGNLSRPVYFVLAFNPRVEQEPPPPGLFQDQEIGPIMVFLDLHTGGP